MALDGFLAAAAHDLRGSLAQFRDELFHPRASALVLIGWLDV